MDKVDCYAVEVSEENAELIKKHFGFTSDTEIRNQLQYWVDLAISEVITRQVIGILEKEVENGGTSG